MRVRFLIPFVLCCEALLAGCASPVGAGAHAGDPYIVNAQRSLFYSFGPAQTTGPDFALYHGQRVTMLSYDYGYSHVAVQGTNQSGYVATEDLIPAPPSARPEPTAHPSATRHRTRGPDAGPPAGVEQSQIPLPAFPESQPPPGAPPFRY